ncbi:hypothetical protein WICPIJ_000328 [Wickerhamomyces pijperi]|uniref:Calcineurin-like phosphoesterase domain-containing protein n=1 Tax=Wickerhamomyces pijperi TaxID=599730 RepID=A0A9P8TRY8_WICPI|nr:hypothetical protein WICPIJ_000328 [Wickerhamomyces pijperi]
MSTSDYEVLNDPESQKDVSGCSSFFKRIFTFVICLLSGLALFYLIIVLPLTNVNVLPVLKKIESLNIKLIPTKSTSFKDDETIYKSEKYITKTKWEELHPESAVEMERLIIIGDVHGSLQYLKNLLAKVGFNKDKDQVIFMGDLITKGDKSMATLDYAMENSFKGVLGNHELNVLSKYISNRDIQFDDNDVFRLPKSKYGFDDESILSRKLNSSHIEYISALPFTMDLGLVPHTDDNGNFLTAKEGLADHMGVPNPKASLDTINVGECLAIEKDWYAPYNKVMRSKAKPTVVFYGHHAGKGLNIREFTKGLDSGCVYGDQLSAIVVWTETIVNKKEMDLIVYKSELVQVECSL